MADKFFSLHGKFDNFPWRTNFSENLFKFVFLQYLPKAQSKGLERRAGLLCKELSSFAP
jgi:hypothetical protein